MKVNWFRISAIALRSTIALLITVAASVAVAAPAIKLEETSVVITNITPHGRVILFALSRAANKGGMTVQTTRQVLTDDDGDAAVEFKPASRIPLRSVWVAIDYESGAFAVGTPAGFQPQEIAEAASLHDDPAAEATLLDEERWRLVYVLVRPGKGAWSDFAVRFGTKDHNRTPDGKLTVSFSDADSLFGKEKGPKKLANGDVLIGIDPGRLDLFTLVVQK